MVDAPSTEVLTILALANRALSAAEVAGIAGTEVDATEELLAGLVDRGVALRRGEGVSACVTVDGLGGLELNREAQRGAGRRMCRAALAWAAAGEGPRACAGWARAARMFQDLDAPEDAARAHIYLGEFDRQNQRPRDALRESQAALTLARRPALQCRAALLAASAQIELQQWDRASTTLMQAEVASISADNPVMSASVTRWLAEHAIRSGGGRGARLAAQAVQDALAASQPALALIGEGLGCLAAALGGDLTDARIDALEQALRQTASPEAVLLLAEACRAAGATDRAQALLDDPAHELSAAYRARAESIRSKLAQGQREARMAEQLVELTAAIAGETDRGQLLQEVAEAARSIVGAERAFVLMKEGGETTVVAAASADGRSPGQPSMSIVRRVLLLGTPLVTADASADDALSGAMSIMAMHLRTALCVPIGDGTAELGVLYVDSSTASMRDFERSTWVVRGLASLTAVGLRSARSLAETRERHARAREVLHDVRNLVSSIHMGLEEIGEGARLDAWAHEILGVARKANDRVLREVRGVLEDKPAETRHCDLAEVVAEVAALLRHDARAGARGLVLQLEEAPVHADPDRMARVVTNLIHNALRYAPPGTDVSVTTSADDLGCHVVVRDRGAGLPEGDLFEAGVQGADALPGLGLGLAICRRLVTEAGGTIQADNHPEGGARFHVVLQRSSDGGMR